MGNFESRLDRAGQLDARASAILGGTAFARRYGGQCAQCGVVRDYHTNGGQHPPHPFTRALDTAGRYVPDGILRDRHSIGCPARYPDVGGDCDESPDDEHARETFERELDEIRENYCGSCLAGESHPEHE